MPSRSPSASCPRSAPASKPNPIATANCGNWTGGNGPGGRATLGDRVDYVITYQIPANTTVTAGQIRDCLPLGFHYVPLSYAGTVPVGGPLPNPGGFPANDAGAGFTAATSPSPLDSSPGSNWSSAVPGVRGFAGRTSVTIAASICRW